MRKTILVLIMVIMATLGIVDAGYITYEKISGRVPPCTAAFKCGDVLNSPYASIGPVPLSVFGLGFYLTFLLIASWYFLNLDREDTVLERRIQKILLFMGVFGFGFSLYLLAIMGLVIKAWCFYCLLSALNCVVLFLTSVTLFITSKNSDHHAMHL